MKDPSEEILGLVRSQGPITFAHFQQLALYHPEFGYYTSGAARSGWDGHYITSAELDPAYGVLWARGFEEIWKLSGAPAEFTVVELGPGEGAFAAAVLQSVQPPFRDALDYALVERGSEQAARQRALLSGHSGVRWHADLAEVEPFENGVVIGNEVLDNQPVHVIEKRDGDLLEVYVAEHEGTLVERTQTIDDPAVSAAGQRLVIAESGRAEVALEAGQLIRTAASRLTRGAVIFVDYGAETQELAERTRGTVVCYSETGVDDDPLERPGSKDITAHVNWTEARHHSEAAGLTPAGPIPQAQVLRRLGLNDLVAKAKREQEEALAEGRGADGFRAIARRQALGALTDPAGLGGLQVFAGVKGIEMPGFLVTIPK